MSKPKILVTGATGKTGVPTTLGLLAKGFPVRVLVHKADPRAERLRDRGAEIVVGSLESYGDIENAMKGVARAYFCPPLEPGTLRRASLFAAAACEAKLEAAVQLSQWVADAVHPALHAREKWLTNRVLSWLPDVGVITVQPGRGQLFRGDRAGRSIRVAGLAVGAGAECAAVERGHRPRDRGLPRQPCTACRQGLSADRAAIAFAA
jgi:uncharacterized protein YbjT (DUF2867 family)